MRATLTLRAVRRGWLDHVPEARKRAVVDGLLDDAIDGPTVKERATAARALAVLDSVDLRRERQSQEDSKDTRRANVDALKALLASDALRAVLADLQAQQDAVSDPGKTNPPALPDKANQARQGMDEAPGVG